MPHLPKKVRQNTKVLSKQATIITKYSVFVLIFNEKVKTIVTMSTSNVQTNLWCNCELISGNNEK